MLNIASLNKNGVLKLDNQEINIFEILNKQTYDSPQILIIASHSKFRPSNTKLKKVLKPKYLLFAPQFNTINRMATINATTPTLLLLLITLFFYFFQFKSATESFTVFETELRRSQNLLLRLKSQLPKTKKYSFNTIFSEFDMTELYYAHKVPGHFIITISTNKTDISHTLNRIQRLLPQYTCDIYSFNESKGLLTIQGSK